MHYPMPDSIESRRTGGCYRLHALTESCPVITIVCRFSIFGRCRRRVQKLAPRRSNLFRFAFHQKLFAQNKRQTSATRNRSSEHRMRDSCIGASLNQLFGLFQGFVGNRLAGKHAPDFARAFSPSNSSISVVTRPFFSRFTTEK